MVAEEWKAKKERFWQKRFFYGFFFFFLNLIDRSRRSHVWFVNALKLRQFLDSCDRQDGWGREGGLEIFYLHLSKNLNCLLLLFFSLPPRLSFSFLFAFVHEIKKKKKLIIRKIRKRFFEGKTFSNFTGDSFTSEKGFNRIIT